MSNTPKGTSMALLKQKINRSRSGRKNKKLAPNKLKDYKEKTLKKPPL